jgi:hypothetical protein
MHDRPRPARRHVDIWFFSQQPEPDVARDLGGRLAREVLIATRALDRGGNFGRAARLPQVTRRFLHGRVTFRDHFGALEAIIGREGKEVVMKINQIESLGRTVAAIILVTVCGAALSQGLPTVSGEVDYASDPTLSDWVGYWIKDCQGHNYRSGQTTDYWVWIEDVACSNGAPCPNGSGDHRLYDRDGVLVRDGCISNLTCSAAPEFGYHCSP